MTTVESLSVPYDPTQPGNLFKQFDLYAPPSSNQRPLLCFVHGGAWRSEDKSQHADLARKLAIATGVLLHAADILQYLVYAVANSAGLYDPSKLFLIGHSCSAHMLASIVLDSSHVDPSLTPPQNVLDAVQGLILSEGIYSLTQLLVRFPKYNEWFIEAAFGSNVKQYDVNTFALRSNVVSPCHGFFCNRPTIP
ncbi:hypothetical protein DL96DRAFT_1703477 [Flagelloscypha sp. PMI_526]|nr:hypothetical protein DL96DRAFT_1703477 [Flagelloscypha sp. PMI_526]